MGIISQARYFQDGLERAASGMGLALGIDR